MNVVALAHETDFDGWRKAARTLVLHDIDPSNVSWGIAKDNRLFAATPLPSSAEGAFNVPKGFVERARTAILNRDPERFAHMYRLLWRLRKNPDLMSVTTDADVILVERLCREIRRDEHKMHAFVRFRQFGSENDFRYVAWFEPAHFIVERAAPFFERRFSDMAWSILTPDLCAHWDGRKTTFTPGAPRADAPTSDPLESIWLTYYASIFNPARLKIKAMQSEMPKKYWRNLPEAALIGSLIETAGRATQQMIDTPPAAPRISTQRREAEMEPNATHIETLKQLRQNADQCRACPLWSDATQAVFGEGPENARVMFVGEQPGDKEDLAGRPFVGPAGQVFDRALEKAGIDRNTIYVTNAVKHFKFVPRGKIRLHQKPTTSEIKACRPWYERERAAIKPILIVAMGATAAQSVLGKATSIGKSRGRLLDLDERTKALVTVHPSYLLRLPNEESKVREYNLFIEDLKIAAAMLREPKHAA